MSNAPCGHPEAWYGLYRKDYDLATPESTAHPAKASWDLAFKILDHLKELGLLKEGDTILDPMAGTGRFNLAALAKGYSSVAVELEEKFIKFCQENKAYAEKKLGRELDWQIIQGDTRQLNDLLKERGLIGITSPPYADQMIKDGQRLASNPDIHWKEWERGRKYNEDNPVNISNLPDHPFTAITSPPYESRTAADYTVPYESAHNSNYGQAEGQIGQEQGQTYLEAMKIVYSEVAKVADVLVVVTKNPTRAGKLRRLDLDTIALLEQVGYKILCQHRAILFEEQEMGHLFEGQVKKPRGRLSFFKRLSYRKGSPVAMWEDVLFAVKGQGQGICAVTSPPYGHPAPGEDISIEESRAVRKTRGGQMGQSLRQPQGYGSTPGQIGNLKDR